MAKYRVETDRGNFEVETDEPSQSQPQTLAGQAANITKNVMNYALPLPVNEPAMAQSLSAGDVKKSYRALMPPLESGIDAARSGKESVIRNLLPNNPASATAINDITNVPMVKPSDIALSYGGGKLGQEASSLRPSSTGKIALEGITKSLGEENLTPELAGQAMQEQYQERVGDPLNILTAPKPAPVQPPSPEPYIPKSGEEILNPVLKSASEGIHPKPVTFEKAGNVINQKYEGNVQTLLDKEKIEWNSLSSEHNDKPANLENTKQYLESVFNQRGIGIEPSYLDRLNETHQAIANQSQNPETAAKEIFDTLMRNKGGSGSQLQEVPEESSQNVPQLGKGMGVLNKIYEISNGSDLNFGQLKTLKTQLGGLIKSWGQRGTEFEHTLKEVYRNVSQDAMESSKAGGFENQLQNANQSTKNYFNYVDKPSSQIISKTNYASDLIGKLIKEDSPERVNELFNEHGFSETEKGTVQRAIIDKMAYEANGDPKKFAKMINDYSPDTRKALFGDKYELVESIKNTAKTLEEEIAKSKIKLPEPEPLPMPHQYTKEEIMSKNGLAFDRMIEKSKASELVSNVLKDGSPEIARAVSGAIGEKSMPLVRRAAMNDLMSDIKIPSTGGKENIDILPLATKLNKLSPEFINDFFGDNAKLVNALRDATIQYRNTMIQFKGSPYVPPVGGITVRPLFYIRNLIERGLLSNKLSRMFQERIGTGLDIGNSLSGLAIGQAGAIGISKGANEQK